jgi:hypothetical protein
MESIYLDKLNGNNQSLVKEIEKYIGVEIIVEREPERKNMGCDMENIPKILTPVETDFRNSSVYHELLHIHRIWVQRIPLIVVCGEESSSDWERGDRLSRVDNNIEHFVIVPEEIKRFSKRKCYWEERIKIFLNKFDSLDSDQKEWNALINWAFIEHVLPDSDLKKDANRLVKKLDIADRANSFMQDIRSSINNKRRLVQVFFKHLRQEDNRVCLKYLTNINPYTGNVNSCIKPLKSPHS